MEEVFKSGDMGQEGHELLIGLVEEESAEKIVLQESGRDLVGHEQELVGDEENKNDGDQEKHELEAEESHQQQQLPLPQPMPGETGLRRGERMRRGRQRNKGTGGRARVIGWGSECGRKRKRCALRERLREKIIMRATSTTGI